MALRLFRDPPTVFTAVEGVEFRRKRFIVFTLSLEDVKLVKHALGCTLLVIVVDRSMIYILDSVRRSRNQYTDLINMLNRAWARFHQHHSEIDLGTLDYVRYAKKTVDRKKHSLEAIVTHAITAAITKLFNVKVSTSLFHRMVSSTTVHFSNMIGPTEPIEFHGHPVAYDIAPSVFGHPTVGRAGLNP
ncbi:wax ester synthase/diacylglycerol acyltransferase 11 [Setaria viridis]|uniref:wax ester synthase/diacylglycerol acyltransferase 11 n=1 Tax=Setaria viridis TaxID=4556 RepID=UPI0014936EB7|nr:uncharacterized protein LOC117835707 [Setaria viridis]